MVTSLQKLKSDYPSEWIERLDLSIAPPSIDLLEHDNSSAEPSTAKKNRSATLESRLADDDQSRELRLYVTLLMK